ALRRPVRMPITAHGTPLATYPTAANWAAPAKANTLIAMTSIGEKPAPARGVRPYTNPNPTALTTMPSPSRTSLRRTLARSGIGGVGAIASSVTLRRVAVDVVVADDHLALDEVAVVVGEEAGDVDVVAGERGDRFAVLPQRDDFDLTRVGCCVEVAKDNDALVARRRPERGDPALLEVTEIGVMVGGTDSAAPASGDH